MISVFLVEDEFLIRKSIKENIDWKQEGFSFVGEAGDGELALPLIKEKKPNILITDVKMPFMDGLELATLVKRDFPQTRIVILSGFREFEYAKKAISIGVTEFLSKPISSQQLLQVIKKIKLQIEEEQEEETLRKMYLEEMKSKFALERNLFLTKVLERRTNLPELIKEAEKLGLDMIAQMYNVMLCRFRPAEDTPENWEKTQQATDRAVFLFSGDHRVILFERGFEGIALVLKGSSETELDTIADDTAAAIRAICRNYPQVEYFGGVGHSVNRLSELHNSYQSANKAFATRFFTTKNQIIFHDDVKTMKLAGEQTQEIKIDDPKTLSWGTIEDFLMTGMREEIPGFVEEYLESLGPENCDVDSFRLHVAMNAYFCALAYAEKIAIQQKKPADALGTVPASIPDKTGLGRYLEHLLHTVLSEREKQQSRRYSLQIAKAREYILAHAKEYGLSLNTVAQQVNMSPNYFSTVFSQEVGKTFIEFLTETRMDIAKELLRTTTMRSSEIAPEIGYQDPHYFGFLFKKIVGCSPKEYRQRDAWDVRP